MAGTSSSREQNFWPGFVDALTNVVLVMVFIVVVFSVSLFYFMTKLVKTQVLQQVEQKVEAQVKQQVEAQDDKHAALLAASETRAEALQRQLSAAIARNQKLEAANAAAAKASASAAETPGEPAPPRRTPEKVPPVSLSGRGDLIIVSFGPGVTSMDAKTLEALDAAIGGYAGAGNWHVELTAQFAEPSPSEGRRLSFYRVGLLRDHLVSKGVAAQQIETLVQDRSSGNVPRSRVTMRLRRLP